MTETTATVALSSVTASQIPYQEFVSRQRRKNKPSDLTCSLAVVSRQQPQHNVPGPCFTNNPPQIESFPRGYPSLSAFLSSDTNFTMFRCFARLHTRVLLHKQDELVELEEQLDRLDRSQSQTSPYLLTTNRRRDANAERQALLEVIEGKLKECDALLSSFLTHLELPEPEESDIKSVANWMDGKKPVPYTESTFLNDWGDLRRTRRPLEKGGLESFLGRYASVFSTICKDGKSKSKDARIQLLKQSKLVSVSRALTMIFAVFTLVVPIGILYSVNRVPTRLWVIAAFTGIFSSALCWLTSSRNHEIFSATAAYCAVMVVFVGSLPSG